MGATYEHSPEKEIGCFPITITKEAGLNELISDFEDTFIVWHWHGDMPGLAKDSVILAYSEGCPRQIVQ